MAEAKSKLQIAWGIALVAAGMGVVIMMPQKIQQIKQIEYFVNKLLFIKFCFYLMAIMLIGGGSKKIYDHYRKLTSKT
jgi:hypothetical protein